VEIYKRKTKSLINPRPDRPVTLTALEISQHRQHRLYHPGVAPEQAPRARQVGLIAALVTRILGCLADRDRADRAAFHDLRLRRFRRDLILSIGGLF
jgi:hypothetical protein